MTIETKDRQGYKKLIVTYNDGRSCEIYIHENKKVEFVSNDCEGPLVVMPVAGNAIEIRQE